MLALALVLVLVLVLVPVPVLVLVLALAPVHLAQAGVLEGAEQAAFVAVHRHLRRRHVANTWQTQAATRVAFPFRDATWQTHSVTPRGEGCVRCTCVPPSVCVSRPRATAARKAWKPHQTVCLVPTPRCGHWAAVACGTDTLRRTEAHCSRGPRRA